MAGARQRLPDPRARRAPVRAHAGARAPAVRGPLRRVRRRRAAALPPRATPQHVADLRIFNPDGSEAELSGNGAREAILYLRRRGWTDEDSFSIHTAAGTIRPTITGPYSCRVDMGQARLSSEPTSPPDRPTGRRAAIGSSVTRRSEPRALELPARLDRQPAVRDRASADAAALAALDLGAAGPADRSPPGLSQPHERLLVRRARAPARRRAFARASSSAAWGRRCPRARARRGAAIAYLLDAGRRRPGAAAERLRARHRRARRRRARGRGRRGSARAPDRLGAARVRGPSERRVLRGASRSSGQTR